MLRGGLAGEAARAVAPSAFGRRWLYLPKLGLVSVDGAIRGGSLADGLLELRPSAAVGHVVFG